MALIGYLGDVQFEVSDSTVRSLSNWKWSSSARYTVHNRHNNHALTEFGGLDPDKISFDIILNGKYSPQPMGMIWKLKKYERNGLALPLSIGEHAYGFYRWTILSDEVKIDATDSYGNILCATVSLELQEYLKE